MWIYSSTLPYPTHTHARTYLYAHIRTHILHLQSRTIWSSDCPEMLHCVSVQPCPIHDGTRQDNTDTRSPLSFFNSLFYYHKSPLLQSFDMPFSTSSFFISNFLFLSFISSFLHFIFPFFVYFLHRREEKYADEHLRTNHTLKQYHFIIYSMT